MGFCSWHLNVPLSLLSQQIVFSGNVITTIIPFFSFSGNAPLPRPDYQMPEPDGCNSYFLGLPTPTGVCILNHSENIKKPTIPYILIYYSEWIPSKLFFFKSKLSVISNRLMSTRKNVHTLITFVLSQIEMGIPAMTKCCNQLDMCYDTCGSNKYRCDSKFRWCLHSFCSDLKKSLGFVSKVEGQSGVLSIIVCWFHSLSHTHSLH